VHASVHFLNLQARDVQVRIMGDFAIIHALTTFTNKMVSPEADATPTPGHAETDNG
jgi:hypothetical protein